MAESVIRPSPEPITCFDGRVLPTPSDVSAFASLLLASDFDWFASFHDKDLGTVGGISGLVRTAFMVLPATLNRFATLLRRTLESDDPHPQPTVLLFARRKEHCDTHPGCLELGMEMSNFARDGSPPIELVVIWLGDGPMDFLYVGNPPTTRVRNFLVDAQFAVEARNQIRDYESSLLRLDRVLGISP